MTSRELVCANVKLERANGNGGVDPVTGYTSQEIVDFLAEGVDDINTPVDVAMATKAVIRKAMQV